MNLSTVSISTLIMTFLLLVGLFFFIKASGKARLESRQYFTPTPVDEAGRQLHQYFIQRAYSLDNATTQGVATFIGNAQPSGFLSVLLTLLAAVGCLCLALVIQTIQPALHGLPFGLLLGAPLAGWYYRRVNTRQESVNVKVEAADSEATGQTQIRIMGHRDELDSLEQTLSLEPVWDA